jgi:RNA polymerase sigma-70 factor (ECF subfamily)
VSRRGARIGELERVYRSRYRDFLRVARAIVGDEEGAHDAVQDGFAAAIRHRGSYRGEGPLEAWVWRAVVNAARRAARTRPLAAAGAEGAASNGAGPDEAGVRAWIAALPERQRLAVFLRYYADLDYRAIAAALEIEIGTVSATLSAAHTALRRVLKEVPR